MRISTSVLAAALAGACALGFGAARITGYSVSGDGTTSLHRVTAGQPGTPVAFCFDFARKKAC